MRKLLSFLIALAVTVGVTASSFGGSMTLPGMPTNLTLDTNKPCGSYVTSYLGHTSQCTKDSNRSLLSKIRSHPGAKRQPWLALAWEKAASH
jgi:hypothetical protein